MFNEFQQEIIAIVAIVVGILVFYFILKKSSTPQTHSNKSETKDIPEVAPQEKVNVVPKIKEEPKIEPLPEISCHGKEEGDFGVITPVHEDKFNDVTDRRKSDKTIQKRSVPEHGKITKQNFSEFAGERILVAEDNAINQKVILGLLAGSGIELVLADDGQEALDILENDTNFLMILMDAHMPRVDGFEATRIIRKNPKFDHIVVVALSGDTASDDIQKMKNAGMSEQLEKPLRIESLYKIIYAYTGKGTHKDEVVEAIMTKNLDAEKGLQTCGGDEDFYREILSEFMTDYANSSDTLGELLRSNNIQAADAYLLDIIGVTSNIGANSLCEIASNIKLALSDTHEQSYFILFDQYNVKLDRLMQEIRETL
ncbi:MAG: response regulator [Sulfuricurvum sp.]|nr:response regulator [Sulfuricurvum sp.]